MNLAEWLIPVGLRRMSTEDYIAFEAASPIKHEYLCGWVFPMWGITEGRNPIIDNVVDEFIVNLRECALEGQPAGIRVRMEAESGEIFYYSEVAETGGLRNNDDDFPHKPKLIVEVVTPSTQATDLHEKALRYRKIETLEESMVVAQRKHEVILFRRAENWQPQMLHSADAVAELRSIRLSVQLSRIYENVF